MIANSVCRRSLAIILFLFISGPMALMAQAGIEVSESDEKAIRGKLTEAGVKKDRADLLLTKLESAKEAVIYGSDGKIIALRSTALSVSKDNNIRAKMNSAKLKGEQMKAVNTALLFGLFSKYSVEDFPSRELLMPAIKLKGYELKGDLKPEDYSAEGAVGDSVIWAYTAINSDAVTKFKSDLPDIEAFKGFYGKALVAATIDARAAGKMELAVEYGQQAVGRDAKLSVGFVLSYLEAVKLVMDKVEDGMPSLPQAEQAESLIQKYLAKSVAKQMDNVRMLNVVSKWMSKLDVTPHKAAILEALKGFHVAKDYAPAKPILEAFDDEVVFTPLMNLYASKCLLEMDSKDAAKKRVSKLFSDGIELELEEWLLAGHVANKLGMDDKASAAVQKAYEISNK